MSKYEVRADVRKLFGSKRFKVDDFEFVANGRFIRLERDEEKTWIKSQKVLGIGEVSSSDE